jgi:hypothetical protein
MGVVNTTYTFQTTDTITSGKMNGIIDDTVFTGDAIFGTTLEVASGKLKVRAQNITSNELASNAVITAKILDGSVTSSKILDGTITNLDINASAAIAGSKISPIFTSPSVISVGDSNNALRITQTGSGNALIVEDSESPDSSPFIIDSNGRVICGYTSSLSTVNSTGTAAIIPSIQQIGGNEPSSSIGIFNFSGVSSSDPSLIFNKSLGSIGDYSAVTIGTQLGGIGFQGSDGTGFAGSAFILASADGTVATGSVPGRLIFSTTSLGGTSPSERMRITKDGSIGIGTTTPTTALHVIGTVTATAFAGPITGNASSATILATGRTIALTGDVTGTTGSFNGSSNVSAATTIANNAITTLKIADNNVTNVKIASGLNAGKITTGTLSIDRISDGAISSVKIADATITAPKLNGAQTGTAPIYGARAFGSIEFAATRAILTGSQNIATVTRDSDSRTDITFTTAMPNANYVVLVTYGNDNSYSAVIATYNRTTTGFSVRHANQSAGSIFQFVVFG